MMETVTMSLVTRLMMGSGGSVTWLGPGGLVQGALRCGAKIKRERERGLGEVRDQG